MIVNQDIIQFCKDNEWEDKKFHAVLCDPPYELGFMGKSWDSTGIAFDPKTWQLIGDQLYPGAYLLAFGGTRTFHRIAVAIEDAGFEIRDTVMWVYGSGFPKSHDISKAIDKRAGHWRGKAGAVVSENMSMTAPNYERTDKGEPATEDGLRWNGYGTALKPSWEPIIIARKPLEGTVAQNALKYGSGALNIDGCRVDFVNENDKGDPNRFHKTDGGDFLASDPSKTSVGLHGGRWPANLIHSGEDEVVGMFPNTKAGRAVRSKSGGNTFGGENPKPPMDDLGYADSGSAARFFYSAKVSKRERDAGLETLPVRQAGGLAGRADGSLGGEPVTARNNHPTLKPISLTTYLAKLILPPKLDQPRRLLVPFSGAGSEVIGALKAGWDEVTGIEQDPEYCKIAEARIKHWVK